MIPPTLFGMKWFKKGLKSGAPRSTEGINSLRKSIRVWTQGSNLLQTIISKQLTYGIHWCCKIVILCLRLYISLCFLHFELSCKLLIDLVSEWNIEFRVVLDCKDPTPPPQVTLQLPHEPHVAQVASTAVDGFSYFSWHYKVTWELDEKGEH